MRIKKSFKNMFAAYAVALSVLPLAVVGVATFFALTDTLTREAAGKNIIVAQAVAAGVETWLDTHLLTLATAPDPFNRNKDGVTPSPISLPGGSDSAEFVSMLIYDTTGLPAYAASYGHPYQAVGFSVEDFVAKVLSIKEVVWSSAFESPGTGRLVVAVGRPCSAGVAVGLLDVSGVGGILAARLPDHGWDAALIQKNGHILAGSGPLVRKLGKFPVFGNISSRAQGFKFDFNENTFIAAHAPVGRTGFRVVVARDPMEAFAPVIRAWPVLLAGLAGSILFALCLSLWLTARLSKDKDQTQEKQAQGDIKFSSSLSFRGIVRGVTHKLSVESELARTKTFLENLMESSFDTVVSTDLHGVIQYITPQVTGLIGYSQKEMTGTRVSKYYYRGVEDAKAIMRGLNQRGGFTSHDMHMKTKDGQLVDVSASVSLLKNEKKGVVGTLGILRDVTYHNRLEASLRHAHKMEAIGTLAGGVAHDFNNLLMGMQGYVSLLLLDAGSDHPHYRRLKRIEKQIKSGSDLTGQLLGLARGGKYKVKSEDPVTFVANAAEMFGRTRKEIQIHQKDAMDIWAVDIDKGQMERVLLNLFVNAWQAMPEGGDLFLKIENKNLDKDAAEARELSSGDYVRIMVSDTGVGMDKETCRKVFDPFFTTKKRGRGTGLGLASAYGIMQNHGGAITVKARIGQGSTFELYLPASRQRAEISKISSNERIRPGSHTILLVDDEDTVLEVGAEMLEALGYTVITAPSGREAVDCFAKKKDAIDLVILDIVMPGMSGEEAFGLLKKIDPGVNVLLSSGYSIEGQATRILEQGAANFIQKPFTITTISNALHAIFSDNA